MIYGGLGVFGFTCFWIVYKRVLRGPVGLVIWGVGKALGSGRATGGREVGGGQTSVTVEVPTLKETGFVEGKEDEVLWREGILPEEGETETVTVISDGIVEEETPVVEVVI
jgi:hypothetical protein